MMKRSLVVGLSVIFLSACGGGGSNSGGGGGGGPYPVETVFGTYRGTITDDVNIVLRITHVDARNIWPVRGSVELVRSDGTCRASAPWGMVYEEHNGNINNHWSQQQLFNGGSMQFDGRTIKSSGVGIQAAYGGNNWRSCSPLVEGDVFLTKR